MMIAWGIPHLWQPPVYTGDDAPASQRVSGAGQEEDHPEQPPVPWRLKHQRGMKKWEEKYGRNLDEG